MRNRGDQLSYGGHSADVCELRLRRAPCFFGVFSVLDIGARAVPAQDVSLLIAERIVPDQEPAIPPVFSSYSCLHLKRSTIGTRPFTSGLQLPQILGMKDSGNCVF